MLKQKPSKFSIEDKNQKKLLLRYLWRSRLGDLREQNLIRQGKGWFHISGMGHEALAAFALQMEPDDYAFPYYRDRAFCTARGLSDHDLALTFFAKRESSSGGRQLTGHFSDRALNIWSHPSPVGIHLLPACGAAWGLQLDKKPNVVYASLGEASARQGDFFEAICFAKERNLPIVFVVQDNRIAISTETSSTNPLALGILNKDEWMRVDGSDIEAVAHVAAQATEKARSGKGPAFVWCDVERFSNHSSADDQRMYREPKVLEAMLERDPVKLYEKRLIKEGVLSSSEAEHLETEIRESVREAYLRASQETDPSLNETTLHLRGQNTEQVPPLPSPLIDSESCRMLDAVNQTFHHALDTTKEVVFFGQDIADPKGGVFNLTKGLSTKNPERAVNSPLAESTIMGVAVGLASYGKRPCFEIQFVDFIYPGWNQLVSNMSTLRWRSFGHWKCPLVIYAPCGGYLPGGALWHSQSAEGSFARIPGINVAVPSTPADAAGLFWSAMHGADPTIILLPKHLMWAEQTIAVEVPQVPFGQAKITREGDLLTLVTWGNCIEITESALNSLDTDLDIEIIDLRSIAPWDKDTIIASVLKTGRLLIVQEDNISASVAQMIVAELCSIHEIISALKSPPVIVSKGDVHIGFNPIYEYGALPDESRIIGALEQLLSHSLTTSLQKAQRTPEVIDAMPAAQNESQTSIKPIIVPILGEGIRVARVVSLLKKEGDTVRADDPLCEIETDKAVFPIESDEDGILESWAITEDQEVSVGQILATLRLARPAKSEKTDHPKMQSPTTSPEIQLSNSALSSESLQNLQGIIPATIEMTCRWETVKNARLRSKDNQQGTVSTAAMTAWVVVQAMNKHPHFSSVVRGNKLVNDPERFNLGVAVARPDDQLETAVISESNSTSWEQFRTAFNEALKSTRHGQIVSKNKVSLSISSMTAYNVRSAIPIVVPPSVGTLFVGAPHLLPDPKSKVGAFIEVASLVLTFDHRWINGVGAAAFLSDVRKGIENFDLI